MTAALSPDEQLEREYYRDEAPENPLDADQRRAAVAAAIQSLVGRRPQSKEELQLYVETFYGYKIPDTAVCQGHVAPLDALWDAWTDVCNRAIWIGPRTGGKTLQFAILDHLSLYFDGDTIANVGAVEEQAKKCYSYFQKFCKLPHFRGSYVASLLSRTTFHNGGELEILPATMNRVNSPHPRRAHWDEIELTTQTIIDEGKSMPTRQQGRPPAEIFTSSRKKAHGPMETLLKNRERSGHRLYCWCLAAGTPVWTNEGEKPIEAIRPGETVWAYGQNGFELRPVSWSGQTGVRETLEVIFENGDRIRATADHQFLTDAGWVAAERLHAGARIVRGMRSPDFGEAVLPRSSTAGLAEAGTVRVRPSERQAVRDLQGVPSHSAWQDQQDREELARTRPSPQTAAQHAIEGRGPSRQVVRAARRALRRAGANRNAHGRLPAWADALGDRGPRLAPRARSNEKARCGAARTIAKTGLPHPSALGARDGSVGAPGASLLRVASVERGRVEPVFDLTIPGPHNFIAAGVVVHNCVFEIIERCPPERHKDGAGCQTCPLADICREKERQPDGTEVWKPGPGRAARANGWMKIEDVIAKYTSISWPVFRAQWLSQRPETSGLVYPDFDREIHVIDYEWNPNFPVAEGIDFGYVNPNVCLAVQLLPNDEMVIFDEIYIRQHTADQFAALIKQKPWFKPSRVRVADPANAGDRATLINHGVPNDPADKSQKKGESSVQNGLDLVRFLLKPMGRDRPLLYVARNCVNTINEFEAYHIPPVNNPDEKDPEERPSKVDDHAMDALRYVMTAVFHGWLEV